MEIQRVDKYGRKYCLWLIKKRPPNGGLFLIVRFRADSNRCRSFCRALPSHSATEPSFNPPKTHEANFLGGCKIKVISQYSKKYLLKICSQSLKANSL